MIAGMAIREALSSLATLPRMGAALALYRAFGFRGIGACYDNPVPGALYLRMELA